MPMLTVSISPEQARQMHAAVDSGDYASDSELVRDALRLWAAVHDHKPVRLGEISQTDVPLGQAEGHEAHCVSELYAAYTVRNGDGI